MLERMVSVGLFPGLLCTNLLLAWLAFHAGVHPELIIGTVTLSSLALLAALEPKLPHNPHWMPTRWGVLTDLLHGLFSNGLANSLVQAAGLAAAFAAASAVSDQLGLWPHGWPLLAQVLVAMALGELAFYWLHRIAHEDERLWPWHGVHHSSERLTVWSAPRNHPANAVASFVCQIGPAAVLGASQEALLLLSVFTTTHGMLQHANIVQTLGPLSLFFSTAEQHRWHHSTRMDQGNANYGSNLMLWDHLFGTYQRAPSVGPAAVGLSGATLPESFVLHMAAPLMWASATKPPAVDEGLPALPTLDMDAIEAALAEVVAREPTAASG